MTLRKRRKPQLARFQLVSGPSVEGVYLGLRGEEYVLQAAKNLAQVGEDGLNTVDLRGLTLVPRANVHFFQLLGDALT